MFDIAYNCTHGFSPFLFLITNSVLDMVVDTRFKKNK